MSHVNAHNLSQIAKAELCLGRSISISLICLLFITIRYKNGPCETQNKDQKRQQLENFMSKQNLCPTCQQELEWQAGLYSCSSCNISYNKVAFCPDCKAQLERLQACGAESYFCNTCNEQKSKSRARIEFQAQ